MSYISNINWNALSDKALMETIGQFIRHHRLEQNKTQSQIAKDAGVNRATVIEFEKGKRSSITTLIQLLRALDQLHILQQFNIERQPSPIQLAELEQSYRKRASKTKKAPDKPKSDW